MQHFRLSIIVSIIGLLLAGWWGYTNGGIALAFSFIWLAFVLSVMEVSLSFDNAVVNAAILKNWDEWWRMMFLTVGMIVAVFGMRLLFPLVIVAFTADIGILEVWDLAISNPNEYSKALITHHAEVSVFGGMFLLMVFLNFIFDNEREIHWLGKLEEQLGVLGRVETISIFVALSALLFCVTLVPEAEKFKVLMAGIWGLVIYVGVNMLASLMEHQKPETNAGDIVKKGSIGGFLYLEVLDASFSFDGVIGAFAITKDIVIIMIGLGIGAMFVRSITIYLVEKETLSEYRYLEHGAHYAIGVLAVIMLLSLQFHIPEVITGFIGILLIGLSLWSSVKHNRAERSTN